MNEKTEITVEEMDRQQAIDHWIDMVVCAYLTDEARKSITVGKRYDMPMDVTTMVDCLAHPGKNWDDLVARTIKFQEEHKDLVAGYSELLVGKIIFDNARNKLKQDDVPELVVGEELEDALRRFFSQLAWVRIEARGEWATGDDVVDL